MRLRLLSLSLAAAVLAACGIAPQKAVPAEFALLTPAMLGATRGALQIVHGAFGKNDVDFQCVVDVNPQQVTLVGLSALGLRWFSLRYDGLALEAETSSQAPELLKPRRVLADLQFALWPLPALQQALVDSAWQVTEPAPATRRLRRDGQLIAEVHYTGADPWQGRLWLSNFEFGYTLAIDSQPLP